MGSRAPGWRSGRAFGWADEDAARPCGGRVRGPVGVHWPARPWPRARTGRPSRRPSRPARGPPCSAPCRARRAPPVPPSGTATGRGGAGVALAEQRTGAHWSLQRHCTAPPGARAALFFGVSCLSATACTAVGSATGRTGRTRPLAERWDGSSWSVQRTPAPSAAVGHNSVREVLVSSRAPRASPSATPGTGRAARVSPWRSDGTATGGRPSGPSGPPARARASSRVSRARSRTCTAVGLRQRGERHSGAAGRTLERRRGAFSRCPRAGAARHPARRGRLRGRAVLHRRRLLHQRHRHRRDAGRALERHAMGSAEAPGTPPGRRHVQFSAVSWPLLGDMPGGRRVRRRAGRRRDPGRGPNGGRWMIEAHPRPPA